MSNIAQTLRTALTDLQAQRTHLERQSAALEQAVSAVGGHVRRAARTRKATPPRRPMSAAQRKAVSARMKRYWAARRKTKQA